MKRLRDQLRRNLKFTLWVTISYLIFISYIRSNDICVTSMRYSILTYLFIVIFKFYMNTRLKKHYFVLKTLKSYHNISTVFYHKAKGDIKVDVRDSVAKMARNFNRIRKTHIFSKGALNWYQTKVLVIRKIKLKYYSLTIYNHERFLSSERGTLVILILLINKKIFMLQRKKGQLSNHINACL